MAGFITIERDIWEHPLFKKSEMSEREAWMWMLARAAWADTQHRVGAMMIHVPRGSFVITLRDLQAAFMWRSDKRVRTFLSVLEREGMIGRTTVGSSNAPKTHVTICKYDEYQSSGRTKDAPKTHGGRTKDAVKEQDNNKQDIPEANASGREAASDGHQADFAKEVFDRAIAFLGRHGVREAQARSFVGKLRKDGNPDAAIFDAFTRCSRAGAVDPIPWIAKALGAPASAPNNDNIIRMVIEAQEQRDREIAASRERAFR